MNEPEINYETAIGGFYGYFRKPSKADRIYVKDEQGHRILFKTALEAHQEAAAAFLTDRYGFGVRGERIEAETAREKAEALFPKIIKQRGKTRIIEVERTGATANG